MVLDLAAFGAQCMFCGDAGPLRPYRAITFLAMQLSKVTANQIPWPQKEDFVNLDVNIDEGPGMQYCDSQRFATSSVLQFVLYRTRCTACVLTQRFCMDLPLAMVVRGLLSGGSLGWYPPSSLALPPPVLGGQHIRIVSTGNPDWKHELTRYGMSEQRVQKLKWEIMRAWDCLVMDYEMLRHGNMSKDEAWLVLPFREHAHNAQAYPPALSGNRHHTLCTDAKAAAVCVGSRAQTTWGPGIRVCAGNRHPGPVRGCRPRLFFAKAKKPKAVASSSQQRPKAGSRPPPNKASGTFAARFTPSRQTQNGRGATGGANSEMPSDQAPQANGGEFTGKGAKPTASMVSPEPGIINDEVRANTPTNSAQPELLLFGPFFRLG